MFGLRITGDAGNLILGDGQPVLVAKYGGRLTVNTPAAPIYWYISNSAHSVAPHYGYCTAMYPKPIKTAAPPFVFAVPTAAAKGGLGLFTHVGGPGAWTGFRVVFIPKLDYRGGWRPDVGTATGWEYHACTFGDAPSDQRFGMRTWNADGVLTFDSAWEVVPFRKLLTKWSKTGGGKYGGNDLNNNRYWGNRVASSLKDCDTAYEVYSHDWGAPNGTLGVLISSLSGLRCSADAGYSFDPVFLTAPMVGFLGAGRARINASVNFGVIQHASTVYPAMNSFALMTADFTHV